MRSGFWNFKRIKTYLSSSNYFSAKRRPYNNLVMQLTNAFIILSLLVVPVAKGAVVVNSTEATELAPQLGINCRGSGLCGSAGATLFQLTTLINNGLSDNAQFVDQQQIACLAHLCAFFQDTRTTNNGATVKTLLQGLLNHGCTKCGSIPTLPGNDVSTGQLTVNYVSGMGCQGIC
ncbi:hypothetical protein MPER_12899 [Moniliophthora perniciosa FA553]|nr:hypothetical protein MPER_12899 [Moniliophthora perniciosa FA553]